MIAGGPRSKAASPVERDHTPKCALNSSGCIQFDQYYWRLRLNAERME